MNPEGRQQAITRYTQALSVILGIIGDLIKERRENASSAKSIRHLDVATLEEHAGKLRALGSDSSRQDAAVSEILVSLDLGSQYIAALYPGSFRGTGAGTTARISVLGRLKHPLSRRSRHQELAEAIVAKMAAVRDELEKAWKPLAQGVSPSALDLAGAHAALRAAERIDQPLSDEPQIFAHAETEHVFAIRDGNIGAESGQQHQTVGKIGQQDDPARSNPGIH